MLDAGAFDPGEELAADLLSQLGLYLAAKKGRDGLSLHGEHRMPGQLFVERRQRGLGAEDQIGGTPASSPRQLAAPADIIAQPSWFRLCRLRTPQTAPRRPGNGNL